MASFAKIDDNNIVVEVIRASQEFIDSGAVGDPSKWIQTSYNTRGGIHYHPNSNVPTGFAGIRKNFAGKGYTYDPARDAFIEPKPYESWVLNENTCQWEAPVPRSDPNKLYTWDEENLRWVERTIEEF